MFLIFELKVLPNIFIYFKANKIPHLIFKEQLLKDKPYWLEIPEGPDVKGKWMTFLQTIFLFTSEISEKF